MPHHVKVEPVKIKRDHPVLHVDAVHVVGYRARCSCGARGRVKPTYFDARLWTFDHLARASARGTR